LKISTVRNARIIFLDVDGVLNGHEWINQDGFVPKINKPQARHLYILLRQSAAKVVLISSWRSMVHSGKMDLRGMNSLFKSHGIRNIDVIDVLPPHDPALNHRDDRTILLNQWVSEHRPKSYVVLDDLPLDVKNLIRPDPGMGLDDGHVELAMRMFERQEANLRQDAS
jgi:hypothetical protein